MAPSRVVRDHVLVRLVFTGDAEEFAAVAEGFLGERVQRNVLATVLLLARRGHFDGEPRFAYLLDEGDRVRAAALRTPPWPLLVCEFEGRAARELMVGWLAQDPGVPGVSGQPATARAAADAWREQTGGESALRMREAMHLLSEAADPPRPAPGELRLAGPGDRELLIGWEQAFALEAGVGIASEAERVVDTRLAEDGQYVWEDAGPVATLGLSAEIAGTVRIGLVYTAPEHRRHGYASSAVAAASRHALARGARQCMLFTDLANPTSNKIYAEVGFRRFADWEEHRFL